MWHFNSVWGKVLEALFWPFRGLSPWIGMSIITLLTGILMLIIFKTTSNQKGLRKTKNKIKAHLLELRLYQDSLTLSLRAQGQILRANMRHIGYTIKPLLVMIVPLFLILVQLNFWFAYGSLNPGEQTLVKVALAENVNPTQTDISLQPPAGLKVETPPLRIAEENEIDWRISAKEEGIHRLTLRLDGKTFTKSVAVSQFPLTRIAPLKTRANIWQELMNPVEPPLPPDSRIKSIQVLYPSKNLSLFGWRIHWLVAYIVMSMLFAFGLKGLFKVEI